MRSARGHTGGVGAGVPVPVPTRRELATQQLELDDIEVVDDGDVGVLIGQLVEEIAEARPWDDDGWSAPSRRGRGSPPPIPRRPSSIKPPPPPRSLYTAWTTSNLSASLDDGQTRLWVRIPSE
jgi:hypothetical protein